ncbi:uncharacterized protein LOC127262032 [Andrographis paniculata]|uniref:uncharacterized protein LOC127262032 n=1 Tax=Andrographis paniculata TaxID=175694 RepID=UPI0021E8B73F|nr:uncharacterized protein LOC127262032 [Andrographis paniculata]
MWRDKILDDRPKKFRTQSTFEEQDWKDSCHHVSGRVKATPNHLPPHNSAIGNCLPFSPRRQMAALFACSAPLPPLPSARRRCALFRTHSVSSQNSTSAARRPAVILPGLGNNTNDYQKLALILSDYGVPTVIAKVSRIDWLRNAAGLLDSNYWRGSLRPRPVLDWYLKRVEAAVNEAKELAQGSTLSLVGHSAGGWLARVYMQEFGISDVSLLLTLGTPHLAPPKGVSGVIDQTRGLLDYIEKNCAKAVYTPELRFVCIAGRYIQGARLLSSGNTTIMSEIDQPVEEMAGIVASASPPTTFEARFVGQGYKQVCGQADVWGDGVVPEMSAHLEGALNIRLDGVYHSPIGADDETRPWYGSPAIVDQWIHHLLH